MSIVHMAAAAAAAPSHRSLSFSHSIAPPNLQLFHLYKPSPLSLQTARKFAPIRMGGGPRTFPGGVSKWQWKRMQAKKAKQLLKARLARERQIYEMRKRAEIKAAVSDLERPWEAVEKAPKLFSVSADEQVKVLADRFQRPGGFDMWSESDGPELFKTSDDLPSARFFPKGVVHSVKPYARISGEGGSQLDEFADRVREIQLNSDDDGELGNDNKDGNGNKKGRRNFRHKISQNSIANSRSSVKKKIGSKNGDLVKKMKQGSCTSSGVRIGGGNSGKIRRTPISKSEVYDMNLLDDGSFGL